MLLGLRRQPTETAPQEAALYERGARWLSPQQQPNAFPSVVAFVVPTSRSSHQCSPEMPHVTVVGIYCGSPGKTRETSRFSILRSVCSPENQWTASLIRW